MSLTEKDLDNIKDVVDFSVERSELRLGERIDKVENRLENVEIGLLELKKEVSCEINDLAEMNHNFLEKLGDHEHRIQKLEVNKLAA